MGLVHADFPFDDWRKVDTPFCEDDRQICLWSTMRFDRVYQTEVRNVRALVHGHVTLSVPKKLGNVLFIDTGGWMPGKGHFTFVELRSLEWIRGPGPDVRFGSSRNRQMDTFNRPGGPLDAPAITEQLTLIVYANCALSRAVAMQQLDLSWYGDLLQKMNAPDVIRPSASVADMQVMKQTADEVLGVMHARFVR